MGFARAAFRSRAAAGHVCLRRRSPVSQALQSTAPAGLERLGGGDARLGKLEALCFVKPSSSEERLIWPEREAPEYSSCTDAL